jgi:hypothetical protein
MCKGEEKDTHKEDEGGNDAHEEDENPLVGKHAGEEDKLL